MVSNTGTLTFVGGNPTIISQITTLTIPLEVVVSLPQIISVTTTPRATQSIIVDPRPPFPLKFMLPPSVRETPYGMPTAMREGLETNASTYSDNAMGVVSPVIPYLALWSSISKHV